MLLALWWYFWNSITATGPETIAWASEHVLMPTATLEAMLCAAVVSDRVLLPSFSSEMVIPV